MSKIELAISSALALAILMPTGTAGGQTIDLARGKQRAEVCMACHGQDGVTTAAPGIPHLAGQDRDYLIKALTAYRGAAARTDETMTAMAKPLTDADILDIAAFFSTLPPKP